MQAANMFLALLTAVASPGSTGAFRMSKRKEKRTGHSRNCSAFGRTSWLHLLDRTVYPFPYSDDGGRKFLRNFLASHVQPSRWRQQIPQKKWYFQLITLKTDAEGPSKCHHPLFYLVDLHLTHSMSNSFEETSFCQ